MNNKEQIMQALDDAIDRMDLPEIDRNLERLSAVETKPIEAEDVKLFAARVQKKQKELDRMYTKKRSVRYIVAAAAIAVLGLTAYAAANMQNFAFWSGGDYVTMRAAGQELSGKQAQELVSQDQSAAPDVASTMDAETTELTFESVEQARADMGMEIPLPAAMPDMQLESATGSRLVYGENESKTVWLSYSDEQGRMMEVTVNQEIIRSPDALSYTTHDVDEGSGGTYKSKTGVTFSTMTESDESGEKTAQIATTMIGDYEYSLVFFGLDEAAYTQIIDSTDLSVYKK